MEKNRLVTILAVRFGNGHWQAAQALKKALVAVYPEVRVEVVNYLSFAGFLFDWLTRLGYHDLMIRIPGLYRRFFAYTNRLRPSSPFQRLINSCGARRFLWHYRCTKPCLLVSTFPVPAAVISRLKEKKRIEAPLVTVITDYTLHHQWLQPATDLYLVGNQAMAVEMVRHGVSPGRVRATGIPLDRRFSQPAVRTVADLLPAVKESGNLPLVLVINGATSFRGDLGRICRMLAHFPLPLVGAVLGVQHSRQRLLLRGLVRGGSNRVFIMGYSQDVPDFMAAATCLISKAGGLTISEALASGLPMIIYRPLPCQEEKNRDFLVASGAALSAGSMAELADCLQKLLSDPEMLQTMRNSARCLGKPEAAEAAARQLEPFIEH